MCPRIHGLGRKEGGGGQVSSLPSLDSEQCLVTGQPIYEIFRSDVGRADRPITRAITIIYYM